VTFTDVDLSDTAASSIAGTVVTPTLANGYVLTAGEQAALTAAFTIDVATHSSVDGSGTVGWHYNVADSALDFLGATDQVVLTFTVRVDDHNGGTAQQDVTITVHGTEDVPEITSSTQAALVTEDVDHSALENAETHTRSGVVTFTDVDLSDTATSSITGTVVTPTLANGYVLTAGEQAALTAAFTIDAATHSSVDGSGTVGWHYN